jgi:hypothetical protein
MAKNELRGASRRQFIASSFAMGAAMGWGPARIRDFISQASGNALAGVKPTQNLVVLVGLQGAHGYPHLLFPQPDSFTNRMSEELAVHFMQSSVSTGAMPNNFGGALANATNYASPPAMGSRGLLGAWAAGERYKRVYGVDNMAFGGFRSADTTSRNLDTQYFGSDTVPSNTTLSKDKKFLVASRETPWLDKYGLSKAITAIDGGIINVFHIVSAHNHYISFSKQWTMPAAATAIQVQSRPTIVPAIVIGPFGRDPNNNNAPIYGDPGTSNMAPGAPAAAAVQNATGVVNLFNSNVAKAMGSLSNPQNAQLFEAYTKGWIGSSKSAQLPTFSRGYRTAKLASNLVGLNLAEKLLPTSEDRTRYGFTAMSPPIISDFRDNLIVAAKALKLGLTSTVVIGYGNNDPHGTFTANGEGGINGSTFAIAFSNFLNAFMDDLMAAKDPFVPEYLLGDNTVIAFVGDVPRTGISRNNWEDPTGLGQNRVWVMSNGLLRSGFFGGDRAQSPGQGRTSNDQNAFGPGEAGLFDPRTGDLIPRGASPGLIQGKIGDQRPAYGEIGMAAVLYAITRGDIRRVNDFYSGPDFPAIQVPVLL